MAAKDISAKLPVEIFKEGDQFIAYCPSLDISTCASTLEGAREMFAELAHIFLSETVKMGTLDDVLLQCGWRKVSRPRLHWEPPRRQFITEIEEQVDIPCPA